MLEIWQPRYIDKKVLIATFKVQDGDNVIMFTRDKKLAGKEFHIDGAVIRQCPVETNGKIDCYAVPMKLLSS